jgi:hypothetical protein
MGLIVNPRGIAGSGKTELVRRILGAFGQSPEALAKSNPPDGPRQLVHVLPHSAGGRPLALIGAYWTCFGKGPGRSLVDDRPWIRSAIGADADPSCPHRAL